MKRFRNRRHVAHAATEMFNLVCDVDSYPKFVPLCEGMRVRRRTPMGDGVEVIVAEMQVGFKAICERYTSRVTCNARKLEIAVEYIDGPFKTLDNRWYFQEEPPDPNGRLCCSIDFYLAYEFKSRALGLVMGAMFDAAFQKYADAFVRRADEIYGRG
jgi:coenzyme Q-binding protein COQ10